MSTPRRWVIVGGLGAALVITSAGSDNREARGRQEILVQREGPAPGLWLSQDRSPSFVPDEIIVKYRDSVTVPVERLLDPGRSFRSATTDASDSLDSLHARFGVRSARPIFRAAVAGRAGLRAADQAAVRRQQAERMEAVRRRFPQRSARAIDRDLPDLSHVYAVALAPGSDVAKAAAEFSADPHVEYAHPNFRATTQFAPNARTQATHSLGKGPYPMRSLRRDTRRLRLAAGSRGPPLAPEGRRWSGPTRRAWVGGYRRLPVGN